MYQPSFNESNLREREITLCATGESLIAYAFATILKMTLIRAIGRYYLILFAPGTFGMRDKIPKFSLAISTVPKANPLRICSTWALIHG
jgi:hypothetical protein